MNIKLKGSQTIEAALVFPVTLFAVISAMYFVFYIHDMTALDTCARYSSICGVYEDKSAQDIAKTNIQKIQLLTINTTSVWTEGIVKNKVRYMGNFTIPFVGLRPFISEEKVDVSATTVKKMKMSNMYIVKVVRDNVIQELSDK